MSETYSVVLTGKLLNDASLDDVKGRVGDAFKLNELQLNKLFGGKPVALKRGLDKKQAVKLSTRLQQLGAHAVIKAIADKPPAAKAPIAKITEAEPIATSDGAGRIEPASLAEKPSVPFTDIIADMPAQDVPENTTDTVQGSVVEAAVERDQPSIQAVSTADYESINCPRCGHEQPFSAACGHCKMDLTMHIKRLERKARVLAQRS